MSTTVLRTVLISITVFISISLLVIILVTGLSDGTTRISNNIGTKDLFRGVDVDDASESRRRGLATVDETENLSERFYSLVRRIREGPLRNLFFGNTGFPGWNAGKMDPTVVGMLPDQPPPLYAVKEEVAVASTSLEPVPPVSSAAGCCKNPIRS
ncbi:hypothetical protein BC829DRAFT_405129 [Chytridium lagenaria]|nr:hypothetical protein BC829DRAFT_405129 [Chytridium lagenaria]